MATFNIQGRVQRKTSSLGISNAKVKVFHLGRTAPIAVEPTDTDGRFNFPLTWTEPGRPDVHFKVTQVINGTEQTIYNENPATQTRFNIADVLAVTLKTDEGLAAMFPSTAGPAYDAYFVFTRVGLIGVNEIDTRDSAAPGSTVSGYANSDTSAAAPNSSDANSPFGGTLDIAGWFGRFANVQRYKVQYNDGSGWQDVTDPLSNSYYEPVLGNWITVPMGPFSIPGGLQNFYKLTYVEEPFHPWIFPDLIARWDSTRFANGVYKLQILGFTLMPDGSLVPSASLAIEPHYGELRLRVDNSPPVLRINRIRHAATPSSSFVNVDVCNIVRFDGGRLRLEFEASDAQGHLKAYSLGALFGHSQSVAPPLPAGAADSYNAHIDATRHWNGGTFTVDYDGGTYTPSRMPTCAYQFRLNATKRTTNGYGNIFTAEDTVHITVQRPPFPP